MKQTPILFSTPMVNAILEDRKTQTRRVVENLDLIQEVEDGIPFFADEYGDWHKTVTRCPFGYKDDLLYVREKWLNIVNGKELGYCMYAADMPMHWDAKDTEHGDDVDLIESDYKWKPSIHMFKSDSRLWLKVKGIGIERLQDISEEDAKAEGVEPNTLDGAPIPGEYFKYPVERYEDGFPAFSAVESFQTLWNSINGKPRKNGRDISWKANPWVWTVEFNMTEKPK